MLGSTKESKVENESQLNSISFLEFKNQIRNCRFELLNKLWLPVLSALILDIRPFWSENMSIWQPYSSYNRSWPISGGQIITLFSTFLLFFFSLLTCYELVMELHRFSKQFWTLLSFVEPGTGLGSPYIFFLFAISFIYQSIFQRVELGHLSVL